MDGVGDEDTAEVGLQFREFSRPPIRIAQFEEAYAARLMGRQAWLDDARKDRADR